MIKPMNMLERNLLAEKLYELANKPNRHKQLTIREMEETIKENEHAAV